MLVTFHQPLTVRAAFTVLAALGFSLGSLASGQQDKVLRDENAMNAMGFLAAQAKANIDSIATVTATYDYSQNVVIGGAHRDLILHQSSTSSVDSNATLVQQDKGQIKCAYSRIDDAFFTICSNEKPPTFVLGSNGPVLNIDGKIAAFNEHVIVRPDQFMHFKPSLAESQDPSRPTGTREAGRIAYIEDRRGSENRQWSDVVSPLLLFAFQDIPLERWLAAYPESYSKASVDEKKIISQALTIIRKESSESTGYEMIWKLGTTIRIVFDSTSGSLPITYEVQDSAGAKVASQTWKYIKSNEIFFPQHIERRDWRNGSSQPVHVKIMELKDLQINEPITKDSFTWKAFGLKRGERLLDKLHDTLYVSDGNSLIKSDEYVVNEIYRNTPSTGNMWLILVNIILILVIVIALGVRRKLVVK